MPASFIFDPNRCTGCDACRLACSIENDLGPDRSWRSVETFNPRHHPAAPVFHLSLACNHCTVPACMYACPAAAYSLDELTGALLLDEDKCIGCKYCSWACPYDAPVFDAARGVMSKCTFCNDRLADGLKPACASLCPTGALDFGELPDERLVNEIDGFPSTDLGPHIRIEPLKETRSLPVMTAPPPAHPVAAPAPAVASGISLRSEWSLAAFTSALAVLAAAFAGRALGVLALDPVAFTAAAALTLGLATLHLGRKARAYRAILNLRRSWLSREIVTVSTFFALAVGYLWLAPAEIWLGVAAALVGFAALLCTDYVYSVVDTTRQPLLHSASVLWTGAFLAGVFTGTGWLAGLAGFGKLTLYVLRKLRFIERGRPVRPIVSALRTGLGLILPAVLWWLDFGPFHAYIVGAVLAGELIDRGEFYTELEKPSPARQLVADLKRRVAGG